MVPQHRSRTLFAEPSPAARGQPSPPACRRPHSRACAAPLARAGGAGGHGAPLPAAVGPGRLLAPRPATAARAWWPHGPHRAVLPPHGESRRPSALCLLPGLALWPASGPGEQGVKVTGPWARSRRSGRQGRVPRVSEAACAACSMPGRPAFEIIYPVVPVSTLCVSNQSWVENWIFENK